MKEDTPDVCQICGNSDVTQFKCPDCGGTFCAAHKSPDRHDCFSIYNPKSGKAMDLESSSEMYYRMSDYNAAKGILETSQKRRRRNRAIVFSILSITVILISGIGYMAYSTYTYYQPPIADYEEKLNSTQAAYAAIQAYAGPLDSDYTLLSAGWYDGFGESIDAYRRSGEDAAAAGGLLKSCPYYNVSLIEDNERAVNETIRRATETFSAQYLSVRLCPARENTVFVYPNGSHCYITEYRGAKDPTYEQLVSFLRSDRTEDAAYLPDSYVCTNFAITLHDNAEAKGIRAHVVDLKFEGVEAGHMIVAFNTVDKGLIYIDDTGSQIEDKRRGVPSVDAIVSPVVGKAYQPKYLLPELARSWYIKSLGTVSELNLVS